MIPALVSLKRLATSCALLAAVALSVGCGPAWTVVKQASPNPLTPQKSFAIEPVRFDGLKVGKKTEQEYLADHAKDAQFEAKWKGDQASIDQAFSSTLAAQAKGLQVAPGAPAAPGPYVVRPIVTFIEPGVFTMVFNLPSEVRMTLQVVDSAGAVVDEITMKRSVSPGSIMGVPTNVSVGERLRECGRLLGSLAAQYLRARTGVK
jgi:hypothetical protein